MTDLTATAIELATIEATIDDLKARADHLRATILANTQPGERIPNADGEPIYVVRRGARRFSPTAAAANLPADVIASATVTEERLDGKALKMLVAPAVWEASCTSEGAPTLARA